MNFKLGFGPMSLMITHILLDYARYNKKPLMIIASRNQVDVDSGYVMSTHDLADAYNRHWSKYAILCRDHCGPYFLDSEKTLNESQALEATKKTIAHDIENGFSLIHIDTSRCQNPYRSAELLFNFALKLSPNIWFEFGTEDNIGVAAAFKKYQEDVDFVSQWPNVKFVVGQTGSLTKEDKQVGSFDLETVKELVSYAELKKVQFKEHNADYLDSQQILSRKHAGVHACNIAPQLGVIQTRTILRLAEYYGVDSTEFQTEVLNSGKWAKWMLGDDISLKVEVAGHYCFGLDSYKRLENQLAQLCNVHLAVENAIIECIDRYYSVLY